MRVCEVRSSPLKRHIAPIAWTRARSVIRTLAKPTKCLVIQEYYLVSPHKFIFYQCETNPFLILPMWGKSTFLFHKCRTNLLCYFTFLVTYFGDVSSPSSCMSCHIFKKISGCYNNGLSYIAYVTSYTTGSNSNLKLRSDINLNNLNLIRSRTIWEP